MIPVPQKEETGSVNGSIAEEPAGLREGTLLYFILIPVLGCQAFGPESLRRICLSLGSSILSLLWITQALHQKSTLWPSRFFRWVIVLLGILTVAQSGRARNPGDAVTHLCLGLSGPILAFWLASTPSMGRHLLKRLPPVVLTSALFIALAGIWQVLDCSPNACLSMGLAGDVVGFSPAVPSVFTHGNYGGTFAAMLVPLVFAGGLQARRGVLQGLWGLALALLSCYLILSRSRAGLVAAGLALATLGAIASGPLMKGGLLIDRPGRRRVWGLIALAAGVGLAWMLMGREQQGWTTHLKTTGTMTGRLAIWRMSLRMVLDYPLFGVGLGNYLPGFFRYRDPDFSFEGQNKTFLIQETPDSAVVEVLCESGLVGFGLLVLAGAWALFNFGRQWRIGVPGREGLWLSALAAMLVAFAAGGVFTTVSTQSAHLAYAWAAVGILAGWRQETRDMPAWGRGLTAIAGTGLILIFLIATLFNFRIIAARRSEGRFFASRSKDLRSLETAIGLYPWEVMRCLRAGNIFLLNGDLQGAKRETLRALSWQPQNPHLLTQMGEIYRRLKMPAEAEASYRESLQWAPRWAITMRGLGLLYLELERYSEARKVFAGLIEMQPDWAEAHYLNALALAFTGEYGKASLGFRRSRELGWPVKKLLQERSDSWRERPEFSEVLH
ncbi:MAG TPA: O-antigen ligase family protein [Planctomycetota bacterium]|nr:O-antigen ligase family protein [Planctomycetota bacterium]